MNYKSIILAGLFLPTFGYAQENANRLEELKEILNQKMDEIRELRELISEGLKLLEYAGVMYWDEVSESAHERSKRFEAGIIEEIKQLISDENNLIYLEIIRALRENRECDISLLHGLLVPRDNKKQNPFNVDAFFSATAALEQEFLIVTLMEYHKCLRELIEITKEIDIEKKR